MALLQPIVFWAVAVFLYLAVGRQFAKISRDVYKDWSAPAPVDCTFDFKKSRVTRSILFPLSVVYDMIGRLQFNLPCGILIEDLSPQVYLILIMLFWPLKIFWAVGLWSVFIGASVLVVTAIILGQVMKNLYSSLKSQFV